jgi:hypothetical protein
MKKSRRMRWAGECSTSEEKRNVYRILVGKPGGKIPLGRSIFRREVNIKIDLTLKDGGAMN